MTTPSNNLTSYLKDLIQLPKEEQSRLKILSRHVVHDLNNDLASFQINLDILESLVGSLRKKEQEEALEILSRLEQSIMSLRMNISSLDQFSKDACDEYVCALKPVIIKHKKALIIDDQVSMLTAIEMQMSLLGIDVECFSSAEAALQHLEDKRDMYDFILTDQNMPHVTGAELVKRLDKKSIECPVYLLSGSQDLTLARSLETYPIFHGLLQKPLDTDSFSELLKQA